MLIRLHVAHEKVVFSTATFIVKSSQVKIIYFSGTQCIQQEIQHDVHI